MMHSAFGQRMLIVRITVGGFAMPATRASAKVRQLLGSVVIRALFCVGFPLGMLREMWDTLVSNIEMQDRSPPCTAGLASPREKGITK